MTEKQLRLFESPEPIAKRTATGGEQQRPTRRQRDLPGQWYLLPVTHEPDPSCGTCGKPVRPLPGADIWLDVLSAKSAGKSAKLARLHTEICHASKSH